MGTLLYLTSNAIRIYAISIFIDAFLGKSKLSNKFKTLSYIAYYLIGSLSWIITKNEMLNILMNIIPCLLIAIQYSTSWKKRIFSTLSFYATEMFIDWLSFTIFKNGTAITSGFVQCIIVLIFAFIFKHIYVRNEDYSFKSTYSWFLILIAFGTIAIGILTVNNDSTHDYLIAIVLLLINLLNFYVYNLEQQSLEKQHIYELISTANSAYQHQIQIMTESQKKMRFMRHDLRKHLNQIRALMDNGDLEQITAYMNEIEEAVSVKREYSKTGNKDVDSLINYELTIASEFGTEVFCDIELPEQLSVSSFDLTVILGNLLDNAVEALRQSEKKVMIVTIKFKKGVIRIDIENSYNSTYKRKPDGKEHGIGLLSVRNTLEKYHGSLKTFPEENRYHTTAVLFNSID